MVERNRDRQEALPRRATSSMEPGGAAVPNFSGIVVGNRKHLRFVRRGQRSRGDRSKLSRLTLFEERAPSLFEARWRLEVLD